MVASRRIAIAIVLFLLAATAAAFVYTEQKKLGKGPISKPRVTRYFSPVCNCDSEQAEIAFRLADPRAVTVRVVRENGRRVRTLAARERFGTGVAELAWDGRTDDGELGPGRPLPGDRAPRRRRHARLPAADHPRYRRARRRSCGAFRRAW